MECESVHGLMYLKSERKQTHEAKNHEQQSLKKSKKLL